MLFSLSLQYQEIYILLLLLLETKRLRTHLTIEMKEINVDFFSLKLRRKKPQTERNADYSTELFGRQQLCRFVGNTDKTKCNEKKTNKTKQNAHTFE